MLMVSDIAECRAAVRSLQRGRRTVGLVPTMGALHEGHMSLMRAAKDRCDAMAATIFVNPTQFGPNEDFSKYPRTLDADLALCRQADVDLVFTPTVEAMYPQSVTTTEQVVHLAEQRVRFLTGAARKFTTTVGVGRLGEVLCGRQRPGHFDGVATVVCKLFNILPANVAFFGEKDYQQLTIIRQMVRDLNMDIEIVGFPTVREADGLAMSSRNRYLSAAERQQALSLSRALFAARDRIASGEHDAAKLVAEMRDSILRAGPAAIDYIEIVDPNSLESIKVVDRPARICLAVRIGSTRLIDNVAVQARPSDAR